MIEKYISIKEASLLFGVTTTTLRRWEKNEVFLPHHRTLGHHRRYKLSSVLNKIKPNKIILKRKNTPPLGEIKAFGESNNSLLVELGNNN